MSLEVIFFDLDGTLYPNGNGMWEAIAERMETYMYKFLQLPRREIPTLRQEYFNTYGTTLRGLQINYSINELEYLEFVHDIPLQRYLKPDFHLKNILENIRIKKVIFTNSDRAHTIRVLTALNLEKLFDGIFDITKMDFLNKPNPKTYLGAIEYAGNPNPEACMFIEDSPRNLVPAKELGMYTVLVGTQKDGLEVDYTIPTIHSIGQLLANFNQSDKDG